MRKEQKLVIGFVGTVVGIVGALHIYLPFYSKLGQQAQTRAGLRTGESGSDASRRSASMWKNMDREKKAQHQSASKREDESL